MRWPRASLALLALATVRAEAGSPPALLVEKAKLAGIADEPGESTSHGVSDAVAVVVGAPGANISGTFRAGAADVLGPPSRE